MPKFPEGPVWPAPWAGVSVLLWNRVSSYSGSWVHSAWDFSLGAFFFFFFLTGKHGGPA